MDKHALAILNAAESWNWPAPSCMEPLRNHRKACEFKTVCRKLLSCSITESHKLGGSLLERFWDEVERCHPQFAENVHDLKHTEYSSPDESEQILFDSVEAATVDFAPVFELAADLFTHIGLAFMISEDRHVWRFLSPPPTSGTVPDTLKPHGSRSQDALKLLAMKRDGTSCPLTEVPFFAFAGADPALTHMIPSSVRFKANTLKFIALLGGKVARDHVLEFSSKIQNVFNMETSAAASHRLSKWGIEACQSTLGVRNGMVQYYFRTFSFDLEHRIGSALLRDGDEISFGEGPEASQLHYGPHPMLCNLRLAVGRALYTSGAAEFIHQLMEDADDTNCPHNTLKDEDFDVLNAKLLISGRAQIV
ncbi:hypothetical protein D9615_005758 [Tricholomella constricta]|uniref:Uncharacterized protein n=1 Tax=Tricholomella constricta TaxID=117010 RepID=A0A8H5H9Z4_9AGAR|nr:hypothetical protein D9615_005758 [Tricholomella constricta]